MTCPICNAEPCKCVPTTLWEPELYVLWKSHSNNVRLLHDNCSVCVAAQRLANHIAEREAILSRLPKTADGVPIAPGDTVWPRGDLFMEDEQGAEIRYSLYDKTTGDDGDLLPSYVYSTREAALAAKEQK